MVAEGIEDDVQARELERLGCTHAQGFLFSRPLPADAVEELLEANQPLGPAVESAERDARHASAVRFLHVEATGGCGRWPRAREGRRAPDWPLPGAARRGVRPEVARLVEKKRGHGVHVLLRCRGHPLVRLPVQHLVSCAWGSTAASASVT